MSSGRASIFELALLLPLSILPDTSLQTPCTGRKRLETVTGRGTTTNQAAAARQPVAVASQRVAAVASPIETAACFPTGKDAVSQIGEVASSLIPLERGSVLAEHAASATIIMHLKGVQGMYAFEVSAATFPTTQRELDRRDDVRMAPFQPGYPRYQAMPRCPVP